MTAPKISLALLVAFFGSSSVFGLPRQQNEAPARPPADEASARRSPQLDALAVSRGRETFGSSCGFCHGQDAQGTGVGPALTTSTVVLADPDGKALGEFLRLGRPQKGMPAFANLSRGEVSDIDTFLGSVILAAHSRNFKPGLSNLVGDAAAGKTYFNDAGKCRTCHSPESDLKGIGSKLDTVTLQDRLVYPRARGSVSSPPPPEIAKSVKVTLPSGESFSGKLVAITDFSVTLIEASGDRRSFERNNTVPNVEVVDPVQAHLDLMMTLKDKDMHDLTAYLSSLK